MTDTRADKRKKYIDRVIRSTSERDQYEALIEYRLGEDFPQEKRDQLWKARRSLVWGPLWLIVGLAVRPFSHRLKEWLVTHKGRQVMREFRRVLSPAEMEALFQGDQDLFGEASA